MPFSKEVRIEALVAAARHCCVCHRYKGVKVEVHHIVPEAQSDDNSAANAIALCHDCHTDAGHYNPQHPRGTKFSPRELRQARDAWHRVVETGPLDVPNPDILYCRYVVCKSLDNVREIVEGDLRQVPVEAPLLIENNVLAFQRQATAPYRRFGRNDELMGDAYPNVEAYLIEHPEVRDLEDSDSYPYFDVARPISPQEASRRVAREDPITGSLLSAGAEAHEVVSAFAHWDECGGGGFQEVYRLRPLWGVYLAATNITDRALEIKAIVGRAEGGSGYVLRTVPEDGSLGDDRQRVPMARLPAEATLLLPVATLAGPLEYVEPTTRSEVSSTTLEDQDQIVCHEDLSSAASAIGVVGPSFWACEVLTGAGAQSVHGFDPSNLYTVTRYWGMGSCPHLFVSDGGKLAYIRELFVETPGQSNSESYVVSPNAVAVVIAELEHETTHIEAVHINGIQVLHSLVLERGDHLEIEVRGGDIIQFTGYYVSDHPPRPRPWTKNTVISAFAHRAV